ncbi:hypothetical protein G6F70_001756 [Rhizopus microsporus]|uniref:Glycogenin n=2 Tax=Rhizopus TaxID=4842 RepID=A0A367KG73_RHIAZ|nr:hypothetical protein G6F71_002370 [Rhizopus microsporus]RCI01177.1 hypothetical protein CU097_015917 [Rhizopus azygosporus]KAG1203013.1 hypothetical protein G6F70_001756 [Rhizopus microsporus]KAG1216223.1 hypothetical protein G6F69_000277 [Rhizopus microsporus]KAG1235779.1 hypothetical protein G6F67_002495 [Rhizopus microsporus]
MVTKHKAAWAVVITNSNDYIKGVVTMKYALHKVHNSRYPLLILYTSHVKPEIVEMLKNIGCLVKNIDAIYPSGKVDYRFEQFSEVWTKLAVWNQTEYDRLVLLDADMLPVKNMDELMSLELPQGWVAASYACTCNPLKIKQYPPHWIPENCAYTGCQSIQPSPISDRADYFNSGLIVLSPNKDKYDNMINYLNSMEDLTVYPFADQDFLNEIFKNKWKPISYVYNALKTLQWAHKPIWDMNQVKNIHFIMAKPWDLDINQLSDLENTYRALYTLWWNYYSEARISIGISKSLDRLLA